MNDLKSELDLAVSKSEEATLLALDILIYILPNISENMLLRVIEALARVGELDMQGIFGMSTGPLFSLSQRAPGDNVINKTTQILEEIESMTEYLSTKKRF
jgi:hypothetical protein